MARSTNLFSIAAQSPCCCELRAAKLLNGLHAGALAGLPVSAKVRLCGSLLRLSAGGRMMRQAGRYQQVRILASRESAGVLTVKSVVVSSCARMGRLTGTLLRGTPPFASGAHVAPVALVNDTLDGAIEVHGRRSENTDLIVEISLQPWHSYRPDGVILFRCEPRSSV